MRKLLLLTAVMAMALATACGVRPTDTIYGAAAPTEELDGAVLFFLNADGGTLTRVVRPPSEPFKDNVVLLGEGPTSTERGEGLTTAIPAAAAPITVNGAAASLVVTISAPVAGLPEAAREQISCTAAPPWQDPQVQVRITGTDGSALAPTCPYEP